MADFRQNVVPTFTRLESENLEGMEQRILKASVRTPIGVIIPALYDDLASPAMQQIVTELANMPFLRRVYISLDRASAEEYRKAYDIVRPLQDRARLLWNDAPAVQRIVENVNSVTQIGGRGKGRAVWMALGYALGKAEVSVLAFHDADIVTYDRAMMVRLLYPVVHLRYQFAKAFYARHSDRLNGRVARLFYFPFVKALRDILGQSDFVDYMADFRYPLSGEFATFATIANECGSLPIGGSRWAYFPRCTASCGRIASVRWRLHRATTTSTSRSASIHRAVCYEWSPTSHARFTRNWLPVVAF